MGKVENGQCAWAEIRYSWAGQAGGGGLDGFLQSQQAAFDAGLPHPDAIRATLVPGTAKKGRVSPGLRTTKNRGKVSKVMPHWAVFHVPHSST